MDEYSNLCSASSSKLPLKNRSDSACRASIRALFGDFTTLLPPSYVDWWIIIVKASKNTFLTHNIQAVHSRQNNIPEFAHDSGSQMNQNDLATPVELCLKNKGRDSGVSDFFVLRFDN